MTLAIALRCKDGIVLATDGKVSRASTAYRAVARIWQKTSKTHHVSPRVLVTGAGELAMIHGVVAALEEAPPEARAKGIEGVLPIAQKRVVAQRSEAVSRAKAIYGEAGANIAPRAYFILAEADPKPRIVYVSEDGDVEDQTHLGYAITGTGDLINHVRLQAYDPTRLTVEQGAVLAYGLVKDTLDSATFRLSEPVQIWTIRPGGAPEAFDDARIAKTEERYHLFREKVHEALESL